MKTLIIYSTKYGCTKRCAEILKTNIKDEVTIRTIKDHKVDIDKFDIIIIGASVYFGKIQNDVKHFCQRHKQILLQKKIAFFVSCYTPKDTKGFLSSLFSKEFLAHAYYTTSVGGVMNYQKMHFMYRKLFQALHKIDGFHNEFHEPCIDFEEIKKLARITNALDTTY